MKKQNKKTIKNINKNKTVVQGERARDVQCPEHVQVACVEANCLQVTNCTCKCTVKQISIFQGLRLNTVGVR